jgi:hypothetical protein
MKNLNLIYLLFLTLLVACSTTKETTVKDTNTPELKEIFTQEVEAEFSEVDFWINLMPNTKTKFHLAGIVNVTENFKYDISFIELRDVVIKQNNKLLYKVSPVVQLDPNLSTDKMKTFRFATTSGLSMTPDLKVDEPCYVEFHFYDGSELYKYILDNVIIEKKY